MAPAVPSSGTMHSALFSREASFLSSVCLWFLGLVHFLSLVQFQSRFSCFSLVPWTVCLNSLSDGPRQSSNELNKADDPRKQSPVCLNGPKRLQGERALSSCRCGQVGRRLTPSLCAFIIKGWRWGTVPKRPCPSLITHPPPLSTSSQAAATLDNNLLSRT